MAKAARISTTIDNRPLAIFCGTDSNDGRAYIPSRSNVRRLNNAVRRLVDSGHARIWPTLTDDIGYYVERL